MLLFVFRNVDMHKIEKERERRDMSHSNKSLSPHEILKTVELN